MANQGGNSGSSSLRSPEALRASAHSGDDPGRKYSVSEIDRMRELVNCMVPYRQRGERGAAAVEERLRTYMLNGTDPEELEAAAIEHTEREHARWLEPEEMNRKFRERTNQ